MKLHRTIHRSCRSASALVETLESRCLMSAALGVNIIVNPGAETGAAAASDAVAIAPAGWQVNASPSSVKYGAPGFPTTSDPGPLVRGKNFFAGGTDGESDIFQTIHVTSLATQIDASTIHFNLSAYLGGLGSQQDNATVFLNFHDANGGFVNQVFVGPVSNVDRNNTTGMLYEALTGTIPATTRDIQVQIHFESTTLGYNEAYADNLAPILSSGAPPAGTVSGTVFNDRNGNNKKDKGDIPLEGATVFVDVNNNGVFDGPDVSGISGASGAYSIAGVPVGTFNLLQLPAADYRASALTPQQITMTKGSRKTAKPIAETQTALLTGNVFGDTDASTTENGAETGIAKVQVYLDLNNNGQFDPFELTTKTDANGNFSFVLPFGTYTVMEVPPTGFTQDTPANPFTVTLALGDVVAAPAFGLLVSV